MAPCHSLINKYVHRLPGNRWTRRYGEDAETPRKRRKGRIKATPPLKAEANEMIQKEAAELKDAALTNKTKDKVDQGDVFNSLTR